MEFQSDNVAGVSPEILAALTEVAEGVMAPYGEDPVTAELQRRFATLFERECDVIPVCSGIAANALGLSLLAGPLESVLCHENAHIACREAGSVEFHSNGARLVPLEGRNGQIAPSTLASFLQGENASRAALLPPRAVSLTQATELGTAYSPAAIAEIASIARRHRLKVHMDGARLANALAAIGCSPSELTWRAGVDVLAFGATKNGTMSADALVVFDKDLLRTLRYRQKRSGHAMSKMRFASAQLLAYIDRNLWMRNARNANRAAKRLAEGLARLPGFEVLYPVDVNLVFVGIAESAIAGLARAGVTLKPSNAVRATGREFRLVTSFASSDEQVDRLVALCERSTSAPRSAST